MRTRRWGCRTSAPRSDVPARTQLAGRAGGRDWTRPRQTTSPTPAHHPGGRPTRGVPRGDSSGARSRLRPSATSSASQSPGPGRRPARVLDQLRAELAAPARGELLAGAGSAGSAAATAPAPGEDRCTSRGASTSRVCSRRGPDASRQLKLGGRRPRTVFSRFPRIRDGKILQNQRRAAWESSVGSSSAYSPV